jgi:hypothetical protein
MYGVVAEFMVSWCRAAVVAEFMVSWCRAAVVAEFMVSWCRAAVEDVRPAIFGRNLQRKRQRTPEMNAIGHTHGSASSGGAKA